MTTADNRRQFERLDLTERAYAVDSLGQILGPIKQVGGGGMLVCECGDSALAQLHQGKKMRLNVVEPDLGTSNIMDVEIRYITGHSVGMQFRTIK